MTDFMDQVPAEGDVVKEKFEQTVHNFEFNGDWREMMPIILKNLLFNILTLSFYRFWGRTNVRRYLWSNIHFQGDPLEYTGQGKELFKGFLFVVFGVFLPMYLILLLAQYLFTVGGIMAFFGGLIILVLYIGLLMLPGLAWYRAQKYRLSKTRWRGIRAALERDGIDYAIATLGYSFLIGITLGLALPYVENKLWSKEANNRRFGTGVFGYNGDSGPLYGAFFIAIVAAIVGAVLFFFIAGDQMTNMSEQMLANSSSAVNTPPTAFILAYFLMFIFYGLGMMVYEHRKLVHFWNNSVLESGQFRFEGNLIDMIKLFLGNMLLVIFSLGILMPIAQMRMVRYTVGNMAMVGDIDFSEIGQSRGDQYSTGEGLAEGFDMGLV